MIKSLIIFSFLFAAIFCLDKTFNNAGGNNLWSNTNNWDNNALPTSNDNVTINAECLIDVAAVAYNFQANSQVTVLTGKSLTISGNFDYTTNKLTVSQSASVLINGYFVAGGPFTFQNLGSVQMNLHAVGNAALAREPEGNDVIITAGLPILLDSSITIPVGFRLAPVSRTFTTNSAYTISFNYIETIIGWTCDRTNAGISFSFNQGANVNTTITQSVSGSNPCNVDFYNQITVNNDVTYAPIVNLYGNNGFIVYGTNTFTSTVTNPFAFDTKSIDGTGNIVFSSTTQQDLSNSQTLTVNNGNLLFSGNFRFSGSNIDFKTPRSISNPITLNGPSMTFSAGLTVSGSFDLVSGQFIIYDSLVNNLGSAYTWANTPTFMCNYPSKTLSLTGTANNRFPTFIVDGSDTSNSNIGCTVSSSLTFSVDDQIDVTWNTTFNNAVTYNNNGFVFSSNAGASILLKGSHTFQQNFGLNNVELIVQSAFTLTSGSVVSGNGILSPLSGFTSSDANINCQLALPSGNQQITITGNNGFLDLNGNLILRNTNLQGTGQINFRSSTIKTVRGDNRISNPNFVFFAGIATSFLDDKLVQRGISNLYISGASPMRYIYGNVASVSGLNLIFVDSTTFYNTSSVNGVYNSNYYTPQTFANTGITFMSDVSVINGNTITFSNKINFNSTSTKLNGAGFFEADSSTLLYVNGDVNSDSNGSSSLRFTGTTNVHLGSNAVFGTTVYVNSDLTVNDCDGDDTSASATLTLQGDRTVNGNFNLYANLDVKGSLTYQSGSFPSRAGYLQVDGSKLVLQSNLYLNSRFIFTSPLTISSFDTTTYTFTLDGTHTPVYNFVVSNLLTITSEIGLVLSNTVASLNAGINGFGSLTLQNNAILSSPSANSITLSTLSISNSNTQGTGPITLSVSTLNLDGTIYCNAPTTFAGSIVNVATTELYGLSFTASTVSFEGTSLSFIDSRTISTNWITNNLGTLKFLSDCNIASAGSLSSANSISLYFYTSLNLQKDVSFTGSSFQLYLGNPNVATQTFVVTGVFTLTLSNKNTFIYNNVVSGGATIVSASPSNYISNINSLTTPLSSIPPEWNLSNTVQLGSLNVTGARTFSYPIVLTNGQLVNFLDGVTFNAGGSLQPDLLSNTNNQVGFQSFVNTNTPLTIPYQILVAVTGSTFTFGGSSTLTIQSNYTCQSVTNFGSSVTFGYTNVASYVVTISNGCYFLNTSANLLFQRATINYANTVDRNLIQYIEPTLTFDSVPSTVSINHIGDSSNTLLFKGNFFVKANTLQFTETNGQFYLNPITIDTSVQNSTISNLRPNATLTFSTTSTTNWIEPIVSFATNLDQSIVLNAPVRMIGATITPQANFISSSANNRVAFVNSLTLTSGSFLLSAPSQLYVDVQSNSFNFNLNGASFIFTSVPSTFNPLGFSFLNFNFNDAGSSLQFKPSAASTLTLGTFTFGGSSQTVRFSTNTNFVVQSVTVTPSNTLWVDGASVTATNVIFTYNQATATPSVFQYTISSASPSPITATNVAFAGTAVVNVNNFNWDGSAVNAVVAVNANTQSVFSTITGTPGYIYSAQRSATAPNTLQFTASRTQTVSPFPTQSNGPSPAVSSSVKLVLNVAFIIISILLAIN